MFSLLQGTGLLLASVQQLPMVDSDVIASVLAQSLLKCDNATLLAHLDRMAQHSETAPLLVVSILIELCREVFPVLLIRYQF